MSRLKQSDVKALREELLKTQGGKCALCGLDCSVDEAVLDHDHLATGPTAGMCRGVLHRGCNALLGPVENRWKRYGVKDLLAFAHGIGQYLQTHHDDPTGIQHYTHRTPDEKKALAKKRRARKKLTK